MKSSALVAFLVLFALAPLFAFGQIAYNTPTAATFKALDAATVSGQIHVQLGQTTGGPWTLCLDAKCNTENTAPFVLANESGDTSDANVIDTTKFADGTHTVTASAAGIANPLTATFTITNANAPAPPTNPGATGDAAVTVGWVPPTLNGDGSTLTDLAGFRIYVGNSPSTLAARLAVNSPSATFAVIDKLATGTWYFAVTAINAKGVESLFSTVVSRAVTASVPPTCPAQPASETRAQACVAPLIGNWSQTRAYVSVAAPACWQAGPWTPDVAPAGVCASPAMLVTADSKAYQFKNATTPMSLVGMAVAGAPCGPQTQVVNGVKYCHLTKSQVDLVVWPSDLALTDYWAKAAP